MNEVLAYVAAGMVGLWGVAHAVPTRQVLAGFDPITLDNRRVLLQEWLAEAVTMWGLAATVIAATVVGGAGSAVTIAVYRVVAGLMALGEVPQRCSLKFPTQAAVA
jgi:hypothetical protein